MPTGIKQVSQRPRSLRAHQAVLDAAQQLMQAFPLEEITVERLSAASGVSTATIYKHWPTKTAVVAEAFGEATTDALPSAYDSGDPWSDLIEFAVDSMTFHSDSSDDMYLALLTACARDEAGGLYFRTYYLDPRRRAAKPLWTRCIDAGVVRPDLDLDLAMDQLFGATVFRLLVDADGLRRQAVSERRRQVRVVIELSAGALTPPPAHPVGAKDSPAQKESS